MPHMFGEDMEIGTIWREPMNNKYLAYFNANGTYNYYKSYSTESGAIEGLTRAIRSLWHLDVRSGKIRHPSGWVSYLGPERRE